MEENNDSLISISRVRFKNKHLVEKASKLTKYINEKCNNLVEGNQINVYISDDEEDTIEIVFATKSDEKIRKTATDKIMETVSQFISEFAPYSSGNNGVEIIPLEGYSTKYLKEDIKVAAEKKRTLCIVDTYDNYYRFTCGKSLKIKHFSITPDNDSYSDVVAYCLTENLDKIKELYYDKLTEGLWLD